MMLGVVFNSVKQVSDFTAGGKMIRSTWHICSKSIYCSDLGRYPCSFPHNSGPNIYYWRYSTQPALMPSCSRLNCDEVCVAVH